MKATRWLSLALALAAGYPAVAPAQRVAAPTGVTVTSNATNLIVSWNHVANAVSYTVNRRAPLQPLGSTPGPPYTGQLPQAGAAYDYQVVSVGKGNQNTAASPWVPYTVPLRTVTGTPGVIVLEPRPPTATLTVIPGGPTSLTARSGIPGQIQLTWNAVPNATAYRVMRSSTAPEPEARLVEYPGTSQLAEGGIWSHTDAPVDLRWTYSYKVYALFNTVTSTPSPVASARSLAVIQPTGLKYGVTPTPTPGRVNVTLSWTGVPNVANYVITGASIIGQPTITVPGSATSYVLSNIQAGVTFRVCVGAVYPRNVGDPGTAPCVDLKLQ